MLCRMCDREIPDESALCFHCGAAQETYIVRRPPLSNKRKPTARGTLITGITLVLVVVVILIAGPIIRGAQKLPRYEEIKTDIVALDIKDELAVTALKNKIDNYNRDDPETSELLEIKRLMQEKMGWQTDEPPAEASPSPEAEPDADAQAKAEAARQILRDTVFDEVLSVRSLTWERAATGQFDVTVFWRNKSDKTIRDIYFAVEAVDADGQIVLPLGNTDKELALLHPTGPFAPTGAGEPTENLWYDVWPETATDIRLTRVDIYYEDNTHLTLDNELIELLWEE